MCCNLPCQCAVVLRSRSGFRQQLRQPQGLQLSLQHIMQSFAEPSFQRLLSDGGIMRDNEYPSRPRPPPSVTCSLPRWESGTNTVYRKGMRQIRRLLLSTTAPHTAMVPQKENAVATTNTKPTIADGQCGYWYVLSISMSFLSAQG